MRSRGVGMLFYVSVQVSSQQKVLEKSLTYALRLFVLILCKYNSCFTPRPLVSCNRFMTGYLGGFDLTFSM